MDGRSNGNGNTVLLTVIGVATLLVALVGATFAYFTATVNNSQAQSVSVTTAAPVGLEYVGQELSLLNAIPGNSGEAEFTVKNPGSSSTAQTYDLDLIIDQNTFNTTEGDDQLEITITGEGTTDVSIQGGTYNVTDGSSTASNGKTFDVVTAQRIEVGETQTYTFTINFKELDIPQDSNQNQNFKAHVAISNPVSVK